MKGTVIAEPYVNLRAGPGVGAIDLGDVPYGTQVDIISTVQGWYQIPVYVTPGGPMVGSAWLSSDWVKINTAPVQPARKVRVGANLLHAHHLAQRAYDLGIRVFQFMDGMQEGKNFARDHKDAVVMLRRYVDRWAEPGAYLFEGIEPGCVYLSPNNEGTFIGAGTPEEIKASAEWDMKMARIVQDAGGIYAGFGHAMGTPDYTRVGIRDAMRQYYAPLYNRGLMAINGHYYSPNYEHVFQAAEWIWYERRWEWMFTHCGFDPNPQLLGVYCDETGVDEGGVGGFPAHGINAEQIGMWCRKFIELSSASMVIDGVSYPSPVRGAAIFQAGDSNTNSGGWGGYNVEYALQTIGAANV